MRLAVFTLLAIASYAQADRIRDPLDEPLLVEVKMVGSLIPVRTTRINSHGLSSGPRCMPASSDLQFLGCDAVRDNRIAFNDFLVLESIFHDRNRRYLEGDDLSLNFEDFRLLTENIEGRGQVFEAPESHGVVFGSIGLLLSMLTLCFAATNH